MVLKKHSVMIAGHKTSITLEDEFMTELRSIAEKEKMPLTQLITQIDKTRPPKTNLSSAIRLHVLNKMKSQR